MGQLYLIGAVAGDGVSLGPGTDGLSWARGPGTTTGGTMTGRGMSVLGRCYCTGMVFLTFTNLITDWMVWNWIKEAMLTLLETSLGTSGYWGKCPFYNHTMQCYWGFQSQAVQHWKMLHVNDAWWSESAKVYATQYSAGRQAARQARIGSLISLRG